MEKWKMETWKDGRWKRSNGAPPLAVGKPRSDQLVPHRLRWESCATPTMYGAGAYQITFDGGELPSGIYFYRLQTGEHSAIGKMVMMK